jgi:hypothetical protein
VVHTVNFEQDLAAINSIFGFLYILHSVTRSPPSTYLVCTSSVSLRNLLVGGQEHYRLIAVRRARTIFIPRNGCRRGEDISGKWSEEWGVAVGPAANSL